MGDPSTEAPSVTPAQRAAHAIDKAADETTRPHRWGRLLKRLIAGLIALALAVITFITWDFGPWTCPTWFPDNTPHCKAPRIHYPIEDYLTTDPGRKPKKAPVYGDFLGMGDATPVDQIAAAFPPGTKHQVFPGANGKHREAWGWKGIYYETTVLEASGATTGTFIFREKDSRYYVSLMNGLLLGHSTVQDAVAVYDHLSRLVDPAHQRFGDVQIEFDYGGNDNPRSIYVGSIDTLTGPEMEHTSTYTRGSHPCLAVLWLATTDSKEDNGVNHVKASPKDHDASCG
jgi:hypothetical protein